MSESTSWERTFVLLKPDAIQRALVGRVIERFERAGLTISAMLMRNADEQRARRHYEAHRGKAFYEPLVRLLISAPVLTMAVEGAHAIEVVRKIVGATEPREALPGSIRGDFCHMGYTRSRERSGVIPNLIHASDSRESAERELGLWFARTDFVDAYERADAGFM